MKLKVPLFLFSVLLLAITCFAQTPTPTPAPTQHFTMSGSVVSYMGPGGSAPAAIADGYVNITKSWLVGYQQITIPSLATAKLGIVDFEHSLSAILGKTLTSKLAFDATQWQVDVFAGAGKLNESALNVNHIAETGGACLSRKLTTNLSLQPICGQWLHGGIVNGPLVTGVGSTASSTSASSTTAVSSGISIHF